MKIIWSAEAKITYFRELEFIHKKWNIKEVKKFISLVDDFIKDLKTGIIQGKTLHNKNLRSFVISKQTTIFFDYHKNKKIVEILLFWNNSQNPKELKKIISKL